MTDPKRTVAPGPAGDSGPAPRSDRTENAPGATANGAAESPDATEAKALSPEEQMALFEKELKENGWGHQPC